MKDRPSIPAGICPPASSMKSGGVQASRSRVAAGSCFETALPREN